MKVEKGNFQFHYGITCELLWDMHLYKVNSMVNYGHCSHYVFFKNNENKVRGFKFYWIIDLIVFSQGDR